MTQHPRHLVVAASFARPVHVSLAIAAFALLIFGASWLIEGTPSSPEKGLQALLLLMVSFFVPWGVSIAVTRDCILPDGQTKKRASDPWLSASEAIRSRGIREWVRDVGVKRAARDMKTLEALRRVKDDVLTAGERADLEEIRVGALAA